MGSGPPGRTDPRRSTSDAVRLRRCGQRARAGRSLHSGVPAGNRRAHHAGTNRCAPGQRLGPHRGHPRVPTRFLPGYQARLRAFGAIPIDARKPLGQVADAILSRTLANPATSQTSKPGNPPGARPWKPSSITRRRCVDRTDPSSCRRRCQLAIAGLLSSSLVAFQSLSSRSRSCAYGSTSVSLSITTKAPSRRCAQRSSRTTEARAGPERAGDAVPGR